MAPPNKPPAGFVESVGGGPAGVVEFAKLNCLDGAGVVEPNGADVEAVLPNGFAPAAGLFKPANMPPLVEEEPRGFVGVAPAKLKEGVEVPLGASVFVVFPNSPPDVD